MAWILLNIKNVTRQQPEDVNNQPAKGGETMMCCYNDDNDGYQPEETWRDYMDEGEITGNDADEYDPDWDYD